MENLRGYHGEWRMEGFAKMHCFLSLAIVLDLCSLLLLSAASPLFLDPNLPDNCSLPSLLLVQDCEAEEVTPILDQEAAAQ